MKTFKELLSSLSEESHIGYYSTRFDKHGNKVMGKFFSKNLPDAEEKAKKHAEENDGEYYKVDKSYKRIQEDVIEEGLFSTEKDESSSTPTLSVFNIHHKDRKHVGTISVNHRTGKTSGKLKTSAGKEYEIPIDKVEHVESLSDRLNTLLSRRKQYAHAVGLTTEETIVEDYIKELLEAVVEIDEVSKATLGSYYTKASKSLDTLKPEKQKKRKAGMNLAFDKMMEGYTFNDVKKVSGKGNIVRKLVDGTKMYHNVDTGEYFPAKKK